MRIVQMEANDRLQFGIKLMEEFTRFSGEISKNTEAFKNVVKIISRQMSLSEHKRHFDSTKNSFDLSVIMFSVTALSANLLHSNWLYLASSLYAVGSGFTYYHFYNAKKQLNAYLDQLDAEEESK